MRKWSFVATLIAAGLLVVGGSRDAQGQQFSCWAGAEGCCDCVWDWPGWFWCTTSTAFQGYDTCYSTMLDCELVGWCISVSLGDRAPDGSVYAADISTVAQENLQSNTVEGVDGRKWQVGCDGVILKRQYSEATLADLRWRLAVIVL